jgi:hypothetical protein
VTMLLWALFVIRMFNRTSGSRHKLGDNIIILVAAFWLGKHDLWLMPGLTAACYVLESQIKEGYFRSLYMAGIACAMYLFVERPAVTPGLTLDLRDPAVRLRLFVRAGTFRGQPVYGPGRPG